MTMGSEFLIKHRKQVNEYNQIKKEVKELIETNSEYKLKNIYYDGLAHGLTHDENSTPNHFAWFVELMDYSVSSRLLQLLETYFGVNCIVSNNGSDSCIVIIFVYEDISYVKQNWEDEVIK